MPTIPWLGLDAQIPQGQLIHIQTLTSFCLCLYTVWHYCNRWETQQSIFPSSASPQRAAFRWNLPADSLQRQRRQGQLLRAQFDCSCKASGQCSFTTAETLQSKKKTCGHTQRMCWTSESQGINLGPFAFSFPECNSHRYGPRWHISSILQNVYHSSFGGTLSQAHGKDGKKNCHQHRSPAHCCWALNIRCHSFLDPSSPPCPSEVTLRTLRQRIHIPSIR